MTTSQEVHDLGTRVSLLEEKYRNLEEKFHRLQEVTDANALDARVRLTEVEAELSDLKTNTALTRQALAGITKIADDMEKDREVNAGWRADQDAKWNKIAGAKWVIGLLFAVVLAFSEQAQHLLKLLF